MRIAQARQLFDDDVVAGHRYGAASKRPNFRQHLERRSESGDLGENLLGPPDHLPVLDVVSGLVPRADQSPVLDRSARPICPVLWHVDSRSYAATTTELISRDSRLAGDRRV